MSQHPYQYPYYTTTPNTTAFQQPSQYSQPQPYTSQQASWYQGWLAYNDPGYVKGLLLGAGVTYLMTNPKVQRAMVKGAITLWSALQGGFEEVKEQILDIKSEMGMDPDDAS